MSRIIADHFLDSGPVMTIMKDRLVFLAEMFLTQIVDPNNNESFQMIMKYVLDEDILDDVDLTNSVLSSRITVQRWAKGKGLPGVALRPFIYKYIAELLAEKSLNE